MKILGTAVNSVKAEHNFVGAPSFGQVNPYNLFKHYHSDEYASAYPNIRAISNEYMKIRPIAINNNGKEVKHPALDALYHPNQKDSSVMFAEKIAVSTLALPMTYILVWRNEGGVAKPGGDFGFKGKNIAGYTFLETPAITVVDKKIHYTIGSQVFTEDEVMALPGGVQPNDLYAGYSPTIASKRWATLDSYIADFQKGFFENNAIPAGMFIITAATETDFEDTKKTMQERHRGAGNNNNVSYVPRPMGQDGKPADSKVEWVPFAQSNKDIDFKPLLGHIDNRLSEAYGVSSIVKGVDSSAKYSNAEVSENGFAKRAVDPLALRNYTQITHELNRITGGLGVAITYKYEIPAISDQEKVRADTKRTEGTIITDMVEAGYTLDSVVDAFDLPQRYKRLKIGTGSATIDNDKPDVDEGNEVQKSPDPTKIDGVTPLNKTDKPKAETSDEDRIKNVSLDFMQAQIDRAVIEYDATAVDMAEPTQSELDAYVEAMMVIVVAILLANGAEQYAAGVELAGLVDSELQGFTLSESAESAYRGYLNRVGTSYGKDTADSIRKVLADSNELGLNKAETKAALKDIKTLDEWRAERLARTELNHSQSMGTLEGIKSLAAETGVEFEKALDHSNSPGTPCPFCLTFEGKWFPIDNPLLDLGEAVEAADGTIFVNDFISYQAGDIHANGRGGMIYRMVQA